MRQGEDHKTRSESGVKIQERGEIFFFYRPKVNREEAHSVDDVQRLYIVLRPESGEKPVEEKQDPTSGKEGSSSGEGGRGSQEVNIEKEALLRFMVMGRKTLPDVSKRSRPYWGYVEMVTTSIEDVKSALEGEDYQTATRGSRHKAPARALGKGVYRILRHNPGNRTHTHLVYKLELPTKPDEPQEALNVERQGSFVLQIKNPDAGGRAGFQGLQRKRKAVFPAHLQGEFGMRRFVAADPPDFLNYEGCEFLLISAADDVEEELGLELETEAEEGVELESCSDLVRMFGDTAPVAPLMKGTWA